MTMKIRSIANIPISGKLFVYSVSCCSLSVVCLFVFASALLLIPYKAYSGYDELKSDLENYKPPHTTATSTVSKEQKKASTKIRIVSGSHADNDKTGNPGHKMMSKIKDGRGIGQRKPFITISPSLQKRVRGVDKEDAHGIAIASTLLKNAPDLSLLEAIVLMRNSEIKAAGAKVDAQINGFTQVENLDQILSRYSAFTEALMNGVGPMKGSEPANTRFPFPGVTALKGEAAAQSVKIAIAELGIVERDAITAIRKAFWKRVYIERQYNITAEMLELFKKLDKVANSLYRSGKTSFQDVIKIAVKLNLLEDSIISIHENRLNMDGDMLALMNLPPDISIAASRFSSPSQKVPALSKLYLMAGENRQELIKIRAMAEKVDRMLKMARTMVLPDFDAGFSDYSDTAVTQAGSFSMKPSFTSAVAASTGAGLPIKPWSGSSISWLEQTRQELVSLHHTLDNSEAQTRKMARSAWSELDRAIRSARLYSNTILELSANALEVSTNEYESGRLSFSEVTGSYSEWLATRLAHAGAVSDIGIARAKLQQIIGISF